MRNRPPSALQPTLLLLVALALALAGTHAGASTPLVASFTGSLMGSAGPQIQTIGFTFRVTTPIVIDGLAVYDSNSDGLSDEVTVGLWGPVNVPALVIPAGTSAALESSFRWVPIAPVTLVPGDYTVGSISRNPAEPFAYMNVPASNPVGLTMYPGTVYLNWNYIHQNTYTLRFPSVTGANAVGWMGANIHVQGATPSLPDLEARTLVFNPATGASYSFQVTGTSVRAKVFAELAWARGPTLADMIGQPVYTRSFFVTTGSYGPLAVPRFFLSQTPADATHLLFVMDRVNAVAESNEGNNVVAVPLAIVPGPNPPPQVLAPRIVRATPGNGQIELVWEYPADEPVGGRWVDSYRLVVEKWDFVFQEYDPYGVWVLPAGAARRSSFVIEHLQNEGVLGPPLSYRITVQATKGNVTGPPSGAAIATPQFPPWRWAGAAIAIQLHSPVDVQVTDPVGYRLSPTTNEIFGSTYEEVTDAAGEQITEITIPYPIHGEYLLEVLPKSDSLPSDTYSITLTQGGQTDVIAQDVAIEDSPPGGYGFTQENNPPEADAGSDQTIECAPEGGTTITLDGRGSQDPDGDPIEYAWTWALGSATGPNPTVALPLGTHVVTLTVTDDRGGVARDEVVVTVRDTASGDVTGRVQVTRGGFRFNRATQRYVQTVSVRNASTCKIAGPVSLVLDGLRADVRLTNAQGTTSTTTPAGSPYRGVNVGSDEILAPGETGSVVLEFANPTPQGFSYAVRVLAGSPSP